VCVLLSCVWLSACVIGCVCISVVLVRMYAWLGVHKSVLYTCTCIRVCVFIYMHGCVNVCMCVFGCMVQRSGPVWWDPDPLQEIWICARYGPDILTIWRPIHGMIRRSVPVRAVKIRRRFGSKIASFHVSVCSCIISLFIVVSIIYMLLVSFHVTVWYILPVWLPVSLHEMSMSVHFNYTVYLNTYQRHFMWWLVVIIDPGLVVV